MDYGKVLALSVGLLFAIGIASAQNVSSEDVELSVEEIELGVGDVLEAELQVDEDGDFGYVFWLSDRQIGGGESSDVEREMRASELDSDRDELRAELRDSDGETLVTETVELEFKQFEIDAPETVEPGSSTEVEVVYGDEVREDFVYEWNVGQMAANDEEVGDGHRVEFETRNHVRRDSARVSVTVTDEDVNYIGEAETVVEWDIFETDVDGVDVEYGDREVEITVSEEELRERPDVRLGEAIDAISEVRLGGRHSGDSVIRLEQADPEDFAAGSSIERYSLVEVSGENIDGVGIRPTAYISEEWLEENDLMISRRQAEVSFYEVEDGDWEVRRSNTRSGTDNHIGLTTARDGDQNSYYMLDSGVNRLGIAGDTDGIDVGNFAIGPEGQCDEFEGDEPIPPGWEEIGVSCDVHSEAERFEERLDRQLDRMEDVEGVDVDERKEKIRGEVDNYRISEAESMMEELREDIQEAQRRDGAETAPDRTQRGGGTPEEAVRDRLERVTLDLPEEVDVYERPENIQELFDQAEQQLENEEYSMAMNTVSELRQEKQRLEGYEEAREMARMLEQIEDYRERDEVGETEEQLLDEAERQIVEENDLEAAEETLEEFQEEMRTAQMRSAFLEMLQDPEVRSAIGDIVRDFMPF